MFKIAIEQEDDGRWIADIVDIPGVMAYGYSQQEAIEAAQQLAHQVLSELETQSSSFPS